MNARFINGYDRIAEGRIEHWEIRGMSVDDAIRRFEHDPRVEYIEPNYEVHADVTPNDTRFPEMWQLHNTGQTGGTPGADIKAMNAWDLFTGSSSVKVGVIDTGVDYNHPDLAANIWTNPGEIAGNGIDDDANGYIDDVHGYDFSNHDGDPFDDNAHGTHTSGTIAAIGNNNVGTTGLNWNAKIVAIKFLSGAGSGSTDGAIAGINYAIVVGVKLTSNSWGGGGYSQALLDAINAAGAAGQLFVAAAGNSSQNTDTTPAYPAAYNSPYIISVASTDHNDVLSSFSNWGPTTVDIAAPGSAILSTTPGNTYSVFSGTSMATPHVAGVCALAWGRYPALTPLQVKTMILAAADVKASLQGKVLTNGRLNAFMTIAEPDSIPPGSISDLATSDPASNSIRLNWTATGDDGNTGRASRYDIRYSTSPITADNFAAAMPVTGPDPLVYGSPQTFEVGGLDFNTTYFFAIKALDEFSNAGGMSNVAFGTTLGIPNLAAAPASFSSSLITGGTENFPLTLTNTGEGTLDFTIPTPDLLFVQPVVYDYFPVPKGGDDPRIGEPVTTGSGGPDAFGYRWIDSNDPAGPTYSWVDITGTGIHSALTGDDAVTGAIPIGFDFPFYGNNFNSVRVCTNGFLSFSDGSTAYDNQPLPSSGGAANMVAPFWDDLDFGTGQDVYTYTDGARFIVSWVGVPRYQTGGPYTFQAILYPTGEIRFQYDNMGAVLNSSTTGIQNATKNVGLTTAFNTNYVENGLAVRIMPLRQWLTVTPTAGRIMAGESMALTVRFNAGGLMGGDYNGNVRIVSNDPDNSPLLLPATLHVTGAADLAVTPTALDFGENFVGAAPTRTITLSNPGTDNLNISAIVSSDPTLTTNFAGPLTLPPLGAQNVTVTYHPLVPSTLNATLTIQSDDPDTPNLIVTAVGSGVPAPAFTVSPTSFNETLMTNTAVSRTLTINNSGGSNYVFTAEPQISIASGTVTVGTDADNVDVAKGETDSQFGLEPMRAGGPDVFGYTYQDSDEPGGPSFGWVDIRSVGTNITMSGDDVNTGPYPLGMAFPFYGNTFTSFRICTNGFISFTSNKTTLSNTTLPNSGSTVPENLLAVYWDDMHFQTVNRAWYYNDGTRTIIQYQDVYRYGDYTHPNTFQVILYPNGTIVYQYLSMTMTTKNSATIGIQNGAKNDGLQVVYNALYIKGNLAIRFTPPARFLTVTPTSGTVPPGGHIDLTVGFNAGGLFGGDYAGQVRISGNDPVQPQLDIPANLHVIGVPDISVSPASLDFGPVFVGFSKILQLSISNSGTDALNVSSVTLSDPAYGVDMSSFTVPALGNAVVFVNFNPSSPMAYPAQLVLTSNDPDQPTVTIALTGNGLIPPDIDAQPASLTSTLTIPATETQTVTIQNTGGSDLNYVVGAAVAATSVPVYDEIDLGKEETDPRPGIEGAGGPDMFGYTWRDSDEPGGPMFDWVDITSIGTEIVLGGDDRNAAGIQIGFSFPFYGNTFNTLNVCSNGWISFTSTGTSYTNQPLPNSGSTVPENLLAAFWDDLTLSSAGHVYGYRDGTRCIISYVGVPRLTSGGPYTFQVILYPSGRIVYQYLNMPGTRLNEATVGIQNATKTDGLTVVYNSNYIHNDLAIAFQTIPDWLTVSPSTGTIPAGGSAALNVLFDSNGLYGRLYEGSIRISSNDPDESVKVIPASLTAIGVPDIAAAPATADFGTIYVGQTADRTVNVQNVGSGDLTVSSFSISGASAASFSVVSPTFPVTLGDRGIMNVVVRFTPGAVCNPCAADLAFNSDDPDEPQITVGLTGNALVPPEIGVAPTSLHAALATTLGPTAITRTKQLVISNTGGSDLNWSAQPLSQMVAEATSVPSGETDKNQAGTPGEPTTMGSGGPDAGGYRWIDSNDPAGTPFSWIDITGVGTPIPFTGDDQNQGPFALPFPFTFYGNTFTSFRLSTNGWLSFTSSLTAYGNTTLPNAAAPENLIAPFWDDLTFSTSGDAYTYYDGSKFIISYVNVPRLSSGGPYTFQIILYPNGTIDFQYLTMQGTRLNEATVGIQNAAKNIGLQVVYNAAYVQNNLRVRLARAPEWLSVSPESGTVPAGESRTVDVTFDATGLEDGDYAGQIELSSNDITDPTVIVPATLHVGVVQAEWNLDPNTLSRTANGRWVDGSVFPPSPIDPCQIRTSSVLVERTVPVATGSPQSCDPAGGYYKFDRAALMGILPVGNSVPVEIIGEVEDVTWFQAVDMVRVLKPRVTSASMAGQTNAPVIFYAGTETFIQWEDPEGYVADHFDLWYTANGGDSWTLVQGGITSRDYMWSVPVEMTEHGRLELVAVDGLGVMGSWLSDEFTIVGATSGVGDGGALPARFDVRIQGANPFRGMARLEVALPEPRNVSVQVFDVKGALVRQLANSTFDAGRHSIAWDGAGSNGTKVSSGIYLVRISAGSDVRLVRLSMMR